MQEWAEIAVKESEVNPEEVFYPHHPEMTDEPEEEMDIEELDESKSIIPLVFPLMGLGIVIAFEMCLFLYSLRHITETTFHREL